MRAARLSVLFISRARYFHRPVLTTTTKWFSQPSRLRCTLSSGPIDHLGWESDKYKGVTVDLNQVPVNIPAADFNTILHESLCIWRDNSCTAVWMRVPIGHSRLITVAAEHGFLFHHAENDFSMLKLWLNEDSPNMLPRFATHQVGVAGAVIREDTKEVLVIQDKNVTRPMWKLPGGVSDLGEDIAETAAREVLEETGIRSDFQSVLAFRQQHKQPGAFGRSDIYVVCRMKPTTFEIKACQTEILKCRWMTLGDLRESTSTPITKRLSNLLLFGLEQGFDKVDITQEKMKSIHKGLMYNLFHRPLPGAWRGI